ncbi:C1 family peptidase [Aurantibacillus circumpalustris]|uniref:C1 family peptidase n=1 Tax=Aurantibacillus circumpalustris TaxID=3036359 RepID=UPI00295B731F|nr:C1 family peptidase [Aurantibacillus circumpalustris]
MQHKLIIGFLFLSLAFTAQEKTNKKDSEYKFTVIKNLENTPVQNQNQTSTCWSFSSLSFFESEIIRLGKGKAPIDIGVNLSEMYVVNKVYSMKADNYVRMHGKTNFGEGGGFPDVVTVLKNYGLVPEEVYTGKKDFKAPHNHKILETTLKNILLPASLDETNKIDFSFLHNTVNSICDEFLGKTPEKFDYKGKSYTPKTYAEATGLKAEDYIFLTSFSHHPFYSPFVLEIPDNWNWQTTYNLPLNEFQEVMSNAINTGYTFAWGADVSEKGFMRADGLAIIPENYFDKISDEEKKNLSIKPQKQMPITQELRQFAFDNYDTQDDHGMHVVGLVKDQNNTLYYIVKNSWGTDSNQCDGYFYASESYVLFKTTSIMLHKKALPPAIAKKLGITL